MHDCREHVFLNAVLDDDLHVADAGSRERKRGADKDIDLTERIHEFLAKQRPVTLGLQILRGQQHLAYFQKGTHILAIVLGALTQPTLVISARLAGLDRQLS